MKFKKRIDIPKIEVVCKLFPNCLMVSIGILTGCVINKNSDNMLKADQIVKYPIVRVF